MALTKLCGWDVRSQPASGLHNAKIEDERNSKAWKQKRNKKRERKENRIIANDELIK